MNKCKSKIFLSLMLGLFIFLMFSFVSAASIESPVASNISVCVRQKLCDNTISGDATIVNVSLNAQYLDQNWSSMNVYMYSAGLTGNISLILVNDSATKGQPINNSNNFSVTIPDVVDDGNDYILIFALWNGSTNLFISENKTVTGILVDSGVPTAPTGLLPTSDSDGSVTFTSTVIADNTTACTLYFSGINPGNPSYSMTHSGSTCTHTLTASEGTYNWYTIASDGTNLSGSSLTQTTNIDIDTGGAKGAATFFTAEEKGVTGIRTLSLADGGNLSPTLTGGIIISVVVIVLLIVGIFIFKRK